MSNEPPTGDGDELVEADLPGLDDASPPSAGTPRAPGSRAEFVEGSPGDALGDAIAQLTEGETADSFDNDPADSVIDELDFDIAQAMVGDPGGDAPRDQPAQPDPTNDTDANDLVEADLPTTSSPRPTEPPPNPAAPEPSFDEVIDDRIREIGENLEASERAQRDAALQAIRDEYGPDVDAAAMLDADREQVAGHGASDRSLVSPGSWLGSYLTLFLAGAGIITAVIAAFAIFGGSDDAPTVSLPSTDATTAPTVAPTTVPTAAPGLSEAPSTSQQLEDLAFAAADAFADTNGDLWLQLQLEAPLAVDPDTLAFVYAFAIGATLQTEFGHNGVYLSVSDGMSYAESLFGSPDFPRTSREFNRNFVIGQADLWITEDGKLAIHMPGGSGTGGLDASSYGADSMLLAGTIVWETEGAEPMNTIQELALGSIAAGGSYPLASWVEIEPDLEPLTLTVPDTSNQN